MSQKLSWFDKLVHYFFRPNRGRVFAETIFLMLILVPLTAVFFFATSNAYVRISESAREQHLAQMRTNAFVVKSNLDRVASIAISAANRRQFQAMIRTGEWEDAGALMQDIPRDFTDITHVLVLDPEGLVKVDTPHLTGISGRDKSFQPWFQLAVDSGGAVVSGVYQRLSQPRMNVVSITVPVREHETEVILGYLVLELETSRIGQWLSEKHQDGVMHLVDGQGNVITSANSEINSFHPYVSMRQDAVYELTDPVSGNDAVIVTVPIQGHEWSVVLEHDRDTFFKERSRATLILLVVNGFVIVVGTVLALFVLRVVRRMSEYHRRDEAYLQNIGDAVFAIDRFWNITLWNPKAAELTGWKLQEVIGKPFREFVRFVNEHDRQENIAFIEETMLYGKPSDMPQDILLVKRDGSTLPVSDAATPLFDADGRITGAIVVFRDVTAEKDYLRIREEFASLASHELRTPITAINGYSDMLLSGTFGKIPKKQKEAVKKIAEAGERMAAIIGGMLRSVQLERGIIDVHAELLDARDLIQDVLSSFDLQIKEKKLDVLTAYDERTPLMMLDPDLFTTVINNIISNAVKYTPEKGQITIRIDKKGRGAILAVEDTGYGIPKEDQQRVFEGLFRADNVKAKVEGTGLGLYITKMIADLTGLSISFTSELNKGTTFFVEIPEGGMRRRLVN